MCACDVVVGAVPGALFGGVAEGFETLLKLPASLINMSKSLGKMTMNLKRLENVSEVRNLFNGMGRTMGNMVNPLSNTTDAALKYVFNNTDDLTNLARTARTVGSMWHDVKNINLALSEGRLEGGFTENRVYEELYNKYYDKYGVAPTDELQKDMRKQAKVAGFQNTWKNTLLVHMSNQIAFPSITKASFGRALPKFSQTIAKVGAEYKIAFNPGKTAKDALYTAEKVSLANSARSLTKASTWGKNGLGYLKANFVEGFQESAQDVLADATENYYVNSFKNKDRQNFDYSIGVLNAAMKKQISAQGLETFASGFAMGSILSIPGGVKDFLSVGYNKYYKHRGNYDQYLAERKAEVDEIVDSLNTMHKNGKYFFDPRMNNYTDQMLVGKVADQPEGVSTKELKDHSFAGFYSAVHTALRSGTFDTFLENYEGYKQATPEEIEDAWSLEPGQGEKAILGIDNAVKTAKKIAARYQQAKNKYKYLINPNDFAEDTPEREAANLYNDAYLHSLNNYVFMGAAFDNNVERLDAMYGKLASLKTIQGSRFSDVAVLTEPERLAKEISMLKNEIKIGETAAATPEAKAQLAKQKKTLGTLEDYQKHQTEAAIDYAKKIITEGINIIKANPNISKDEARAQAVENVSKQYEEAGIDPFENYKQSFKEVLRDVAGNEEKAIALDRELDEAGGLDEIFELLMDTHILRNENMNLNKFINILNSPASFYEHVQRNFDVMKKIYDNRQEYYDDVVNNSLTNIQRNTLLETLAEEGIFVDLEEFAKWCEDKTMPTYFIDQVNKRVIDQGSYLYDKYAEKFKDAEDSEVTNPPKPKTTQDEKLDKKIEQYNQQREGELEKVKNLYDKNLKELLGFTQEEIDDQRNEASFDDEFAAEELELIQNAIVQLENAQEAAEIQAVVEVVGEKQLLTPQEVNLAKEDIFSDEELIQTLQEEAQMFPDLDETQAFDMVVNRMVFGDLLTKKLDSIQNQTKIDIESIPQYEETKPYEDYTENVNSINKKYDDLIEKAKADVVSAQKKEVEKNRTEEMKKSIKEVQSLFKEAGDIVQTKRNYIVNGEAHERMSNRIKSGYDTYSYNGAAELSELIDEVFAGVSENPELDPDLANIDPIIIAARNGDVEAQRQLQEYGLEWEKKTTYRFVGQSEVDALLANNKIESQRGMADIGIDVTTSPRVTTAANAEYRVTFNDSFDVNNGLGKVKLKNEELGDANLERGRGYSLSDVAKIEAIDENGNVVETLYDAKKASSAKPSGEFVLTQDLIDRFISALEEADLPGVNSNNFTLDIVRDELETLIAPEGTRLTKKTQKNVSRLENSIAEIDSKLAETKDAKRQATLTKQKESLQKALASEQAGEYNEKFELTGANLKTFISNIVKENAYQESRDGGDLIDPMLKDYLDTATSVKPEFNPDLMTKEAYDALFDDETGYLTEIKKLADSGEIYIFTKDLIVHSNNLKNAEGDALPPVAGEIDMIIVDRKGNKYIVDLKTGKTDKWMNYKVMNTKSFQKQLENTLQQTGYANLAENMSGQKFGIKIFPIEVSYDKKGKMISAGKPTNPILFGDEETIGDEVTFPYTITLSSDNIIRAKDPETGYYEDMSIANLMQKLVPNMSVKGEIKTIKTSKAKPKMVPEEEKAFADSYVEKLNELRETSNEEALMDLIEDLDKNKPYLSSQTYNMLKTMLDNEALKILDELGNIDVKLGEIYIFTQPVESMKIPQGYRVLVKSINPENGTVELERVGPGRKKPITMSAADFNDVTMNEESLNNVPQAQEQYEPTQDELANISESMSVISDELSDFEQVAKWNEEASADNVSLDQLKNNFFDNFKC